jgi:hypothetical protein
MKIFFDVFDVDGQWLGQHAVESLTSDDALETFGLDLFDRPSDLDTIDLTDFSIESSQFENQF